MDKAELDEEYGSGRLSPWIHGVSSVGPPDGAGTLCQAVIEVNESDCGPRVNDLSTINYLLECWCGDMDMFGEAWVLNEAEDHLVYSMTYRPESLPQTDGLCSFETSAPHVAFGPGQGIPGMAWQQADTVWMDLDTIVYDPYHIQFNKRLHLARELFTTFIAVPLYREGKQLAGVVVAYSPTRISPDATTLRYTRAMADLTGPLGTFMALRKCFNPGSRRRVRRDLTRVKHILCTAGPARLAEVKLPQQGGPCSEVPRELCHRARQQVADYTGKMTGGKLAMPPRMAPWEAALTWCGVFATISTIGLLQKLIQGAGLYRSRSAYVVMTGSLGALSTLVFAVPSAPLAQPRVIILAHIFTIFVALAVYHMFGSHELWLQSGLAVATSVAGMAFLGITHPPAGAICLAFIIGSDAVHGEGAFFLVCPALLGCVVHIVIGLAVNNLSTQRKYPMFW